MMIRMTEHINAPRLTDDDLSGLIGAANYNYRDGNDDLHSIAASNLVIVELLVRLNEQTHSVTNVYNDASKPSKEA